MSMSHLDFDDPRSDPAGDPAASHDDFSGPPESGSSQLAEESDPFDADGDAGSGPAAGEDAAGDARVYSFDSGRHADVAEAGPAVEDGAAEAGDPGGVDSSIDIPAPDRGGSVEEDTTAPAAAGPGEAENAAASPKTRKRRSDSGERRTRSTGKAKAKGEPTVNEIVDRAIMLHNLDGTVRHVLSGVVSDSDAHIGTVAAATLADTAAHTAMLAEIIRFASGDADELEIGFEVSTWRDDKAKVALAAKTLTAAHNAGQVPAEPLAVARSIAALSEEQVDNLTAVQAVLAG